MRIEYDTLNAYKYCENTLFYVYQVFYFSLGLVCLYGKLSLGNTLVFMSYMYGYVLSHVYSFYYVVRPISLNYTGFHFLIPYGIGRGWPKCISLYGVFQHFVKLPIG